MRRYILDTGIAADYIHHRKGVFERARQEALKGNRLGLVVPILGELFAGAEGSASRERNLNLLRRAVSNLIIWPFERSAAEEYGRIAAELRRIGRPMQQIDIQIAAIARTLGRCTVVSSDRDLAAVPALDVENWTL